MWPEGSPPAASDKRLPRKGETTGPGGRERGGKDTVPRGCWSSAMGLSVGKATEGTGTAWQSHQQSFSPKHLSPELAGCSHSSDNSLRTPKTKAKQAKPQPFGGSFPEPPYWWCFGDLHPMAVPYLRQDFGLLHDPGEDLGHRAASGRGADATQPCMATFPPQVARLCPCVSTTVHGKAEGDE